MDEDQGFTLPARVLRLIEQVIVRVLRQNDARLPRGDFGKFTQSLFLAKTDETITGRSGTTPGSGDIIFWKCDDTTLASTSVTATAYNLSEAEIEDDKYVMVARIGNKLWIVFEDCGA